MYKKVETLEWKFWKNKIAETKNLIEGFSRGADITEERIRESEI